MAACEVDREDAPAVAVAFVPRLQRGKVLTCPLTPRGMQRGYDHQPRILRITRGMVFGSWKDHPTVKLRQVFFRELYLVQLITTSEIISAHRNPGSLHSKSFTTIEMAPCVWYQDTFGHGNPLESLDQRTPVVCRSPGCWLNMVSCAESLAK